MKRHYSIKNKRKKIFSVEKNIALTSEKSIQFLINLKSKFPLLVLGLLSINLVSKYSVQSLTLSEKVAFCEEYAGSNVPFYDTDFLYKYERFYNFCMKDIEKKIIRYSYEKERGYFSPAERQEMKNKMENISSERQANCEETRKEISPGFFACDLVIGKGATASGGNYVFVEYIGKILNGIQFDTSFARASFFSFTIGEREVIKGWDQGITGMKEGGIRKLVIPPGLAYGSQEKGEMIPPNSTLVFLVHLLKVN